MTTTIAGFATATKGQAPHRRAPRAHGASPRRNLRPLEDDERDGLRESMKNGYDEAHPIVVWKETGPRSSTGATAAT